MMRFSTSRSQWFLALLALFLATAWAAWVYSETRAHQLVTRSALRNHHAFLAESGEDAPPPKHSRTTSQYVVWKDLPSELQSILGPVERRWDYLSANQRKSLLAVGSRYATMTEEQQIRFNARLVEWTKLTGKERRETRYRYKVLQSLPPEQQEQVKRSWFGERGRPENVNGLIPTSL